MTSRQKVDWRVPSSEWDQFVDFICSKYGEREGYTSREVESAMREWVDLDRGSGLEEKIDCLVRAAGRRPADLGEKRSRSTDRLTDDDTTRVSCYVHEDVRAEFKAIADDTDDRLGVALARALREYRQGGRPARLKEKLSRIADDAEDLLSEIADDGESMSLRKKRTIKICHRFDDADQFTEQELHEAIADVAGETVIDVYQPRVLDRLSYARHPTGNPIYMPVENARDLAEQQDLPGPDAPPIDRKEYSNLSRDEKVDGLRIELARNAASNGGEAAASVKQVHDDIFGGKGSESHMQSLMDKAAEIDGYRRDRSRGGHEYLIADLGYVDHPPVLRELEQAAQDNKDQGNVNTDESDQENGRNGSGAEPTGGQERREADVEDEAAAEMDALMGAQPARTDGGADIQGQGGDTD